MAFKKSKSFNFKVLYTFLGLSLVMGVLVTAANSRVSVDSRASNTKFDFNKKPTITDFPPRPTSKPTSAPTPTTPIPTPMAMGFYLKTTDNIKANPGIASTVVAGCNAGDIALSAGMENYGGSLNKWKTVRSTPSNSTDMNGFLVTMLNEDSVAQDFTITIKCLKYK